MPCTAVHGHRSVFHKLTNRQICLLDYHLACDVDPTTIKREEPNYENVLRLLSVREEISSKEIDLAAEIMSKASSAMRTLLWADFVRNTDRHPHVWMNERISAVSKISALVSEATSMGAYNTLGRRNMHPGPCPMLEIPGTAGCWHRLLQPIALSGKHFGFVRGSYVDILERTRLEHNAWEIRFKAGVSKIDASHSIDQHSAIVFPCELEQTA